VKRLLWIGLALLLAASLVAERFIRHDPDHTYWFSHIPAFFALFGFLGCVATIYIAKQLIGRLIYRPEDYYDRLRSPDRPEAEGEGHREESAPSSAGEGGH
jgi:hypothetical protein